MCCKSADRQSRCALGFTRVLYRFEMLAFKSDVSHWKNKKEMVGVSVRYVIIVAFSDVPEVDRVVTAPYVDLLQ